jgi:hypothetical protein
MFPGRGIPFNSTMRAGLSVCKIREDDGIYVAVVGPVDGSLFERVLGVVIYELGRHSDNLMVDRIS